MTLPLITFSWQKLNKTKQCRALFWPPPSQLADSASGGWLELGIHCSFFLFLFFFIVVQVRLSPFSPHHTTPYPSHPYFPPFYPSLVPFVHVFLNPTPLFPVVSTTWTFLNHEDRQKERRSLRTFQSLAPGLTDAQQNSRIFSRYSTKETVEYLSKKKTKQKPSEKFSDLLKLSLHSRKTILTNTEIEISF